MNFGRNNMEVDIKNHLMKALIELDLVKEELEFRQDYKNAIIINDCMEDILKYDEKMIKDWIQEKEKWNL